MIAIFILVVSIYCMMAVLVHVYYALTHLNEENQKHYVLHSDNEADILEWYYYCFRQFSKRMGVNVSITLVNQAASSHSISMIERWQREDNLIRHVYAYEGANHDAIHINLNNSADLKKLPF